MRFVFFSHLTFEPWDYRNPDEFGIGGSETSHIEMCSRLAQRGHEVISYAPIRPDCDKYHRGVTWEWFEKADLSLNGIWVVYRCPEFLEILREHKAGKEVWFVQQDVEYHDLTEERAEVIDKVICLCMKHADYTLLTKPYLKGKVAVSSNGVKVDIMREIDKEVIARDIKKLVWSSSPDRGLLELLRIVQRARFYDPDISLDIYYGYDNIDKFIAKTGNPYVIRDKERIFNQIKKDPDNINWIGRKPQRDIMRAYKGAGMWCYPSNFPETSCITSMESQALGAIPICIPTWAQKENVMHGLFIEGNAYDGLTVARFAADIVQLANLPTRQAEIRKPMMNDARVRFNWERYVDQWEAWALNIPQSLYYGTQFAYQIKHSVSSKHILNIGCHIDGANLQSIGAVNMDVVDYDAIGKKKLPVNVVHDIRKPLPENLIGKFDCVIMGDMLEHMTKEDAVLSLRNAKTALFNGGKIVVTCPTDYRTVDEQSSTSGVTVNVKAGDQQLPGIYYGHERAITLNELTDIVQCAGLKPTQAQQIDYTHFSGWGVVCI